MIDKKKFEKAMGVNGEEKVPQHENETLALENDKLLELMKTYLAEQTPENLNTLVNHIRTCRVLSIANLNDNKVPVPVFIKNPEGDVFLPVYTDKEQIPQNPGAPLIVNVPYLECNAMVAKDNVQATGIVLNPFTTNLVFKEPLIKRIEEVEQKRRENPNPQVKTVQMTEEQYVIFERKQFESVFLPKKLFAEKEAFVEKLLAEKEPYVDQLFEESYQQKRMYPYLEEEFSVTTMMISDEIQMIRTELPKRDLPVGACERFFIAWNPITKEGRYFMIEKMPDDMIKLAEVTSDWQRVEHCNSIVEGTELQFILDVVNAKGNLTS